MRKSVERRQKEVGIERPDPKTSRNSRRLIFCLSLVLLSSLVLLGLSMANNFEQRSAKAQAEEQAATFAKLQADIAARKKAVLERAQKREADALANDAAYVAAQKHESALNPQSIQVNATVCDVKDPSNILVVLNKKHCFDPIDWAPDDLVSVDGYNLRREAAEAAIRMLAAAQQANVPLEFSSAYRSYTDQQTTYANWVTVNGSQAAADTVSARPGFSEHQTGLAADFKAGNCALECFQATPQYAWLSEHAVDFGFIRRYPVGMTSITGYSPEAWHWRYVGPRASRDMKQKNLQTLEAYLDVTGGDFAK